MGRAHTLPPSLPSRPGHSLDMNDVLHIHGSTDLHNCGQLCVGPLATRQRDAHTKHRGCRSHHARLARHLGATPIVSHAYVSPLITRTVVVRSLGEVPWMQRWAVKVCVACAVGGMEGWRNHRHAFRRKPNMFHIQCSLMTPARPRSSAHALWDNPHYPRPRPGRSGHVSWGGRGSGRRGKGWLSGDLPARCVSPSNIATDLIPS